MNRSWPFLACASDAARVFRSTRLMLSTVTLVLCFCPHSTANFLLNHSSNAGTKWLHCRIFSVFCCAAARSGNRNAGPSDPAAMVPAAPILKKSLRDTPLFFFSSFIFPSSGVPKAKFYSCSFNSRACWRVTSLPFVSKPLQVLRHIAHRHFLSALHHHPDLLDNIGIRQCSDVPRVHLVRDRGQHPPHDFTRACLGHVWHHVHLARPRAFPAPVP